MITWLEDNDSRVEHSSRVGSAEASFCIVRRSLWPQLIPCRSMEQIVISSSL